MHIKLIPAIFLFSYLCAFYVHSADAQTWQSLNKPLESQVLDIVIQSDTVYAAISTRNATLFKRSIHKKEWIYFGNNGLDSYKAFTLDKQGNYYAVDREVVFPTEPAFSVQNFSFSEDYGQSWKIVENLVDMGINEIFIVESGEVLLGGSGIYLLSEDKKSFNTVDSTFSVNTFYQHHDTLIAGGFNGIATSVDAGKTWEKIGPDTLQIQSVTSVGDLLLIATNNNIILKEHLHDDGELISNLSETKLNVLHTAGSQVYAGTESGIMLIDTENLTANPVFPTLTGKNIYSIDSDGDSIYTGTDSGLYKCSPEQNSCALDGIPGGNVQSLTIQGQDTLLTSTSTAIYRYFIDDEEWDTRSVPLPRPRNIVPIDQENFHAVNLYNYYRCSFSDSECETFEIDEEYRLTDIAENSAGQLFVASSRYVYQSDDGGNTWDIIYTHPNNSNHTLKANGDSLLFINGEMKLSLDKHDVEQLPAWVHHITSDGTYYGIGESGVEKSIDSGETWTTLLRSSHIIEPDYIKSIVVDEVNDKIYAISRRGRVFVTENDGVNWGLNTEMYPISIQHTVIGQDGTLYLGSASAGVFKNSEPINPPITISNEGEPVIEAPIEFSLNQNYPNPFNPTTAISYQLPVSSEVSLEIYDMLGRRVALLVDEQQPAGTHSVHFDGSALSSGTYIYRLQTDGFSEIRKMTLIK